METTQIDFLKENKVSDKYAKELTELAEKNGYSSVRFFIAPDQNVSAESVIEDAKSFFSDLEKGEGVELLFHTK